MAFGLLGPHRRHISSRLHDAGSVMSCSRLSPLLFVLLCVLLLSTLRCFALGYVPLPPLFFARCNVDRVPAKWMAPISILWILEINSVIEIFEATELS
jgi:hypothetical protein